MRRKRRNNNNNNINNDNDYNKKSNAIKMIISIPLVKAWKKVQCNKIDKKKNHNFMKEIFNDKILNLMMNR